MASPRMTSYPGMTNYIEFETVIQAGERCAAPFGEPGPRHIDEPVKDWVPGLASGLARDDSFLAAGMTIVAAGMTDPP